jgi:transcriptional regulator with XRE-family HTH domain
MPRCWAVARGRKSRALPVDQLEQFPFVRCHFGGARLTAKALRPKDYFRTPQTLGQHLKKRRRELGLRLREAGEHMGVSAETVANWEKDNTKPVPSKCKPVIAFLGYDPSPEPKTLAERVEAKRRVLGLTFEQVADYLGWDPSTLTHYLNGTWRLSQKRAEALDRFLSLDGEAGAAASAIPRRRR